MSESRRVPQEWVARRRPGSASSKFKIKCKHMQLAARHPTHAGSTHAPIVLRLIWGTGFADAFQYPFRTDLIMPRTQSLNTVDRGLSSRWSAIWWVRRGRIFLSFSVLISLFLVARVWTKKKKPDETQQGKEAKQT
jgi:hypothetical protein